MWGVYFASLFLSIFWLLVLIEEGWSRRKEDLEYTPRVSVVVPAYNEGEFIGDCIQSLLSLDYPKDKLEVIVVNDGSTDKTREICESFGNKIKLVNLTKNSGRKAIPLNIGLQSASGEFVACLDADSVVDPHALRRMLPYFDDDVSAVTPALKVRDPKNMLQKMQWYEYLFAILLRKLMSLIDCIYVTPGPFSLYRREVVLSLGGFDEKNITEDMELALRLQANNHRIKNAHDAYVYTNTPERFGELYKQRKRWYYGLLYNSSKYKSLFFNKSYGDFGILMPLNIISVMVLVISTPLILYYTLNPLAKNIWRLFLVNFDIMPYITNFSFNFNLLDIDYLKLLVILAVGFMGVLSLLLSNRFSNERIRKHGVAPVVAFMLLYFLFLGVLWIGTLADLPRISKRRW
jgi:cellulose synthase/poly-beta-1,6-N-acetylglucosamine synthase-like glycosyltransferase